MKNKILVKSKDKSALKMYLLFICFHLSQGASEPWLSRFTPRHFYNTLYYMTRCEPAKKRIASTFIRNKPKTKIKNNS